MGHPATANTTAKSYFMDLDAVFERAERSDIPLTPAVAMALRRAANADKPNLREMVKILAMDPLLCGQLLRSAKERQKGIEIRALRDAAAVLGTSGVLDVIRAAMSGEVFRVRHYGACFTSVGQHARATGSVAYVVAKSVGVDGREAYLGGLMHEVGFAAALATAADEPPPIQDAWQGLEIAGRHATRELLCRWGLDGSLATAVDHLYDENAALTPMLVTLRLAHELTDHLGAGVVGPWGRQPSTDEETFVRTAVAYGLDRTQAAKLRSDAQRAVASL